MKAATRKLFLFVNVMIIFSVVNGMNFKLAPMKGAAKGKCEALSQGFRLSMERTPGSQGFVAAGATMKTTVGPNRELMFRWRGGAVNKATTFGLLLSVRDLKTGKHQLKIYKVGSADGTEWRQVTLGFDRQFKLKTGSYELYSIRFVLTGKNNPGKESSIEISNVAVRDKVVSPSENAMRFKLAPIEGVAKGKCETIPGGCRMIMEQTPGSKGLIVVGTNLKAKVTPQQKLTFRWRGGANNQATSFGIFLSVRNLKTNKSTFKALRVGSADGPEWRKASLRFDRKFKLTSGSYEITSLRFVLNGKGNPQAYSSVDITNVAITDEEELVLQQGDFLVVPATKKQPEKKPAPAGFKTVKVFFDFDNNDFQQLLSRRNKKPVYEKTAGAGFRDLVLQNCGGIIERVDSPEQADVIVYSRTNSSPFGKKIAKAVQRGAGLVAYGKVHDSDVAVLLPAGVSVKQLEGLAMRDTVVQSNQPIFGDIKFNDVDFGIYFDLKLREGAKTVLTSSSGRPLILEKGKVLQYGVGIGSTLLPSDVFYDKLLLHSILWCGSKTPVQALKVLSAHEQKVKKQLETGEQRMVEEVTDAAGISRQDSRKYSRGMSHNNIGRFGYLIAEGLPCDNIDSSLKVVDVPRGIQGYTFDVIGKKAVPLKRWQVKKVSGEVKFPRPNVTELDSGDIWRGIGKVEYRCDLVMKPEWKGKILFLEVKDGISDCDEAWFNGRRIGGTGKNVTHYWSRHRRYVIPQNAIKWGKANEFRVVIENLHHGACFNSRPELVIASSTENRKLSVTDINWIYTKYKVISQNGTHSLALNLVTPFILYDFSQHQAEMRIENIADYAAFSTASGIKLVDLRKDSVLYDLRRDGKLAAPWILLFRRGKTSPLMLALSRNISSIRAGREMGAVDSLVFQGGLKPLGEIVVGRPWGINRVDTSNWGNKLPENVVKKVTGALDFAFNFPVACDEIYRVDRGRQKVDIVNRFRFYRVKDEWNTKCSPYAVVPPVTGFALKNKIFGASPETLQDFGMNTKFGPILGVRGKGAVCYSLPLPGDWVDPVLPKIAGSDDKFFIKEINECAIAACKWSCRSTPAEAFNPVEPLGKNLLTFNIDPFGWQMGMGVMLEGYFQFGPEAKRSADERIRKRILEPMDLYRYKNFESSRVEPFSGIEYTVNFRSIYPSPVKYAPGFGSKLIFGDSNEAYAQVGWIAALMGDRLGYARQVRNAWPHYKYLVRCNTRINDWAFNSSSCREYGIGGWMDMLNCEYPAMYYHARLAEIAGDAKGADDALYRTAKSMVPTLARLWFDSYLTANHLNPGSRKLAMVFGFNEHDGAKFSVAPLEHSRYIRDAVDIFDFSQGFPGALAQLYKQRAMPEIRKYLMKQAIPALIDKQGKFDSTRYLTVLAQFCKKDVPLEKYAADTLIKNGKRLRLDRPGFNLGFELGNVMAWKYDVPRIQICHGVKMETCAFDVKKRQMTLVFTGSPEAAVVIPMPRSLTCNGKLLALSELKTNVAGIVLPVNIGENSVTAQY